MFMQKLERTFAMKTQLPGAKAALGVGWGKSPEFGRFRGLPILYAFLRFMHLVYKISRRYLESYGR